MKTEFNHIFYVNILNHFIVAKDDQVSSAIRDKCRTFVISSPDPYQIYNFLLELSKIEGKEISHFVRAICEVDKYFINPMSREASFEINFKE